MMVLEFIDAFAKPWYGINNAFDAAAYPATKPDDMNGLDLHIKELVKRQQRQQNWVAMHKMPTPSVLKTWQNRYSKCNKNAADCELKRLEITMQSGQILFHGGVLRVKPIANRMVLSDPLSTSFSPIVAISNALYKGKAYVSNALHINVLRISNPKARVYPFKPNRKMSHEMEVLLESGLTLGNMNDHLVRDNYEVTFYDSSTHKVLRRNVEYHVIEWDVT